MTKKIKYIHIRHWDYWWGVYNISELKNEEVSEVEFSLSNDPAGEDFYFHFDFYTLPVLETILADNEFIETDTPDYPSFLTKYRALRDGKLDYFVGALYYQDFHPTLDDCQIGAGSLFDKKSPSISPYYAVVFLKEVRPLLPEMLVRWLERLSFDFFAERFDFVLVNIPSQEKSEKEYKDEQENY